MTDLTTPAEKFGGVNNETMAHAFAKAGGHDGYIVDGTDLSPGFPQLDESGVNGFEYAGSNGLEATFDGGEAYVYGWLCRDRQTSVSLPANSTVTVSVGFDVSAELASDQSPAQNDNVLLGINNEPSDDVDFADGVDPELPLYEVTTDGSSVTGTNNLRPMGRASASSPWASDYEHPDTLPGPLTIESADFRDHLTIDRDGVGTWDVTPTTRTGGGLLFSLNNDEITFEMMDNGNLKNSNEEYFVQSDRSGGYKIVKNGTDGSGVINFKT